MQPTNWARSARVAASMVVSATMSETAKRPPGLKHAGGFAQYLGLVGGEVDHAVGEHHVDAVGGERDGFDVAFEPMHVGQAGLSLVCASKLEHLVGHVEAVGSAGRGRPGGRRAGRRCRRRSRGRARSRPAVARPRRSGCRSPTRPTARRRAALRVRRPRTARHQASACPSVIDRGRSSQKPARRRRLAPPRRRSARAPSRAACAGRRLGRRRSRSCRRWRRCRSRPLSRMARSRSVASRARNTWMRQ